MMVLAPPRSSWMVQPRPQCRPQVRFQYNISSKGVSRMSGFGFFFWRILLGIVNAPAWIIIGYVFSYLRVAFGSFWGFVAYGVGIVTLIPLAVHALFVAGSFLENYFNAHAGLGDMIDDATWGTSGRSSSTNASHVSSASTPSNSSEKPRNDCVWCEHEKGSLPNGDTGGWCAYFGEPIWDVKFDVRAGRNEYPHSGRAIKGQMHCQGFQLSSIPEHRKNWQKQFS